jgi:hypothetical protein
MWVKLSNNMVTSEGDLISSGKGKRGKKHFLQWENRAFLFTKGSLIILRHLVTLKVISKKKE